MVSGLCDVGACEEGVLKDVFDAVPRGLRAQLDIVDETNTFIRVVGRTQPVPTDPVVIRDLYDPDPLGRASALGRAAADVVRRFYNSATLDAPFLERRGDQDDYKAMVEDLNLSRSYGW